MAAPIMPKKVMKLPRLRTKDELVKIAPELFAALLPEEAEATAAKPRAAGRAPARSTPSTSRSPSPRSRRWRWSWRR